MCLYVVYKVMIDIDRDGWMDLESPRGIWQ